MADEKLTELDLIDLPVEATDLLYIVRPSLGATGSKKVAAADLPSGTPPADSITNAMLAEMAANTVKINATASTANPTDLAMAASTIIARLASGDIVAATTTEIRTLLALVIGTNVQAYDADLTTWAGITPGTNIGTALAVNVGTDGAPVIKGGAGGTPSSLVLTNATALPAAQLVPGVLQAGSFTFGENTLLLLDAALADQRACGIGEAGTAGDILAFGDLCYLSVADSRWELTDADADATSEGVSLGMCVLAAAADGDPTVMLTYGKIRADSKFPTFTVGASVYVSIFSGQVQVAQPSGTDDVIRKIGSARTADELFFNPSEDSMTHT